VSIYAPKGYRYGYRFGTGETLENRSSFTTNANIDELYKCVSRYCKVSLLVLHHVIYIAFHSLEPLSRQQSTSHTDSFTNTFADCSHPASLSSAAFLRAFRVFLFPLVPVLRLPNNKINTTKWRQKQYKQKVAERTKAKKGRGPRPLRSDSRSMLAGEVGKSFLHLTPQDTSALTFLKEIMHKLCNSSADPTYKLEILPTVLALGYVRC